MSLYVIQGSTLGGIADAIRTKKGTSSLIAVTDLATEIASISGGGGTAKFARGSVTLTMGGSDPVTVEHGLGVIPNLIICICQSNVGGATTYTKGGWYMNGFLTAPMFDNVLFTTQYNTWRASQPNTVTIDNIDEDYFDLTPDTYELPPEGGTFQWFALYIDTTS